LERTQEAPAIQDRRSFDMILSALQEATWVFVARLRDACPVPTDDGAEPGGGSPPNRDYF
jgi:hypothetical protein